MDGRRTASFAGGVATLQRELLASDTFVPPGQDLEFVATFSGGANQNAGFGPDAADDRWALFGTSSGGALFALTYDGVTPTSTPLPGSWLGAPHRFRIEWASALVNFYIDGTLVATRAQSISSMMRPVFSERHSGTHTLVINSVRLAPYATAGTFTSRVLDAGAPTVWASALSDTSVPTGTTLDLSVRFGDTAAPDGTWTSFGSVALGNATLAGTSRYAQYRIVMTGTADSTPELASITLSGAELAAQPSLSVTGATVVEGNSGAADGVHGLALRPHVQPGERVVIRPGRHGIVAQRLPGGFRHSHHPGRSAHGGFVVPITGDAAVEADETFAFTLTAPVNASLGQALATGTILDDDLPSVSIADAAATEGDSGTRTRCLRCRCRLPAFHTVTVPFATANGTAVAPQDYTSTSGVLTFPAGTTTRDINVPVVGDTRHEASKNFTVTLGSPVNAVIQDGSATGLIADNDPIPAVTIDDISATEHDSGTAAASVTVRLSRDSDQVVTLSYATADGTATSPADYTASSGTVTFAPGEITKTIAVSMSATRSTNRTRPSPSSELARECDHRRRGEHWTIIDDDPTPR